MTEPDPQEEDATDRVEDVSREGPPPPQQPDAVDFVPWNFIEEDKPSPLAQVDWYSGGIWTIKVHTQSESGEELTLAGTTFHVHKNILTAGSKYFERLFQGRSNFMELEDKTSTIELKSIEAEAFPIMLNFIYSRKDAFQITTKHATALHSLGQYFEICRLRWEVIEFVKKDLCMDNIATYYEHGKLLNDEQILKLVVKECRTGLPTFDPKSPLMEMSDVALWRNIIHHDVPPYLSKHLSRLIAEFCESHSGLVDASTLAHMTDSTHMPEIDKNAAVRLLRLEGKILPQSKDGYVPSDLQSRCIDALAQAWKTIDVDALEQDLADLNKILPYWFYRKALEEAKVAEESAGTRAATTAGTRVADSVFPCFGANPSGGAHRGGGNGGGFREDGNGAFLFGGARRGGGNDGGSQFAGGDRGGEIFSVAFGGDRAESRGLFGGD